MRVRAHLVLGLFGLTIGGFVGCGSVTQDDSTSPNRLDRGEHEETLPPAATDGPFESDDPRAPAASPFGGYESDASPPPPSASGFVDDASARWELDETDIVRWSGHRLYALSRRSGLSVIDISKKDRLTLLGRFRTTAKPFEMYVRGDRVIAIYSAWQKTVYDAASQSYRDATNSEIVGFDVADPSNLRRIGSFELPGEIFATRIAGDVLYVASQQSGDCWQCNPQPTTVITSLDLSDPSAIRRIDELDFTWPQDSYGPARRGVAMTPERIYVAGPETGPYGPIKNSSTIRVVDVADPTGDMRLGVSVQVTGTVTAGWQMNEHDGVLRVVALPDLWDSGPPPRVSTFEVLSSDEIRPLGSVVLSLSDTDALRTVRFDGLRAYALPRTGSLFTIDLSNPSQPEQKGYLDAPGTIYHLEPQGDRLYVRGRENGNKEGSRHVSLFDVSDSSNPTLLDRIHLGPSWSSLREDPTPHGLHIVPDAGLLLVPLTPYAYPTDCGGYTGRVQLIDIADDRLRIRGTARLRGATKHAFVHEGRLLAMSDERAHLFDIDNRDAPAMKDSLSVYHRADRIVPAGDKLVRIAIDWWSGVASLEVARTNDAGRYEPLGSIDLDEADGPDQYACGYGDYRFAYARVFVHGTHVYVVVPSVDVSIGKRGTTILVVDIANASAPRIVSRQQRLIYFTPYAIKGQTKLTTFIESGDRVVQLGTKIAILADGFSPFSVNSREMGAALHVLDFEDPKHPRHTELPLPNALERTGLHAHGDEVLFGRWTQVPNTLSRVRFHVDRVNVSNPAAPKLLPSVNVPGSLLSFDAQSGRLLTVDYRREVLTDQTSSSCREHGVGAAYFDESTGTCTLVHRSLELVEIQGEMAKRIDSQPLPDGLWVRSLALGDDRIVFVPSVHYRPDSDDCVGCGVGYGDQPIYLIAGIRTGKLATGTINMDWQLFSSGGRIAVSGQQFVMASEEADRVGLLDLRGFNAPKAMPIGEVQGFARDIVVQGDSAFVALGHHGVQTIELPR